MALKDLLETRKAQFDIATKEILDNLTTVREGIDEFMEFKDLYAAGGKLKWDEVVYIEDTLEDAIVILVGVAFYPVGTEVETGDGSKVKVTEDTKGYFTRLIRMGFPLNLVEGTKEDIIEFLVRSEKIAEEQLKKELAVLEMDQEVENEQQFDYSQLTADQIAQLQKFNIIGKA